MRRRSCALVAALTLLGCHAASAQTGCGYTLGETVPDGPTCGFGSYGGHIQDIMDDGTVCGYASTLGCPERAFVQSPGGPMVFLPNPPGSFGSRAYGMNSAGTVVGFYYVTQTRGAPCKWENGVCVPLPIPPQANGGEAAAINSFGVIAGHWFNSAAADIHACTWDGAIMTDRHPGEPWVTSMAVAINDAGMIAGDVSTGLANSIRGFRRESDGTFIVLPALSEGLDCRVRNMNVHGDVVGRSFVPTPSSPFKIAHAFLWRDGVMHDLGVLPGFEAVAYAASDISDAGRVIGTYNAPPTRIFICQAGTMSKMTVNGALFVGSTAFINQLHVIASIRSRYIPATPRPADIDENCVVNVTDLLIVIEDWGKRKSPADTNSDGIVNVTDLLAVIGDWGP